ncbi:hypothetical protein [Sinorhizobium meliloti]|uniref:hypothetical protein n=1 Tax=Rhizobium meliloti TaxID=382 RepID=UPI001147326D|nr:hypothetical protein [Sinorhizobium meliloti]
MPKFSIYDREIALRLVGRRFADSMGAKERSGGNMVGGPMHEVMFATDRALEMADMDDDFSCGTCSLSSNVRLLLRKSKNGDSAPNILSWSCAHYHLDCGIE